MAGVGTYGIGLAPVARLGRSGRFWRHGCWRGRRGTLRHPPLFHVADVVLGDTHLRFTGYPPSLCVAGVALGDIHRHFAWHVWHLWHWAGSGGALGFRCGAVAPRRFAWQAWHLATCSCTLSGRDSTWRHVAALCVAGVALGDIHRHFAWHAWHAWHWAGSGGADIHRHFAWQAWHA